MKVIFLDIDGVLNSKIFDKEKDSFDIMDPTRLVLLKKIVDETGAEIVLTSSWRHGWAIQECDCQSDAAIKIWNEFANANIFIMDKTTEEYYSRTEQIKEWLSKNPEVESYVILDDIQFGWEELEGRVVKTHYLIDRGLEDRHVKEAIEILNEI